MIERLDDNDWFSLSTGIATLPLARATAAAKRAAISQLERDRAGARANLEDLVAHAARALDREHPRASERVLLVTADDRYDELAQPGAIARLAAAARGHAMSTANAGAVDRGALHALAIATGGNYYAPSATELDQLTGELAGFARQPARDVVIGFGLDASVHLGDVLPGESRTVELPAELMDSCSIQVWYSVDPSIDAPYGAWYIDWVGVHSTPKAADTSTSWSPSGAMPSC